MTRAGCARRRTPQFLVCVEALMPNSLVPQLFDFLDGPNSAASAGRGAVQSRRSAAKFKYFWKCASTQQGIGQSGVEDVASSRGVHRVHPESGTVMELGSVPCHDTFASERRSRYAGTKSSRDLRQGLQQIRNAEKSFREFSRADHEIH